MPNVISHTRPVALMLALALVALLGSSCSGSKLKRKPVQPVSGQAFYQGKPMENALIIFHPVDDPDPEHWRQVGYPRATVGRDGTFKVTTYETDDGAPPGTYDVSITWPAKGGQNEEGIGMSDQLGGRYSDPKTAGLRRPIKEGVSTLEPFRLQ